MASVEEEEAEYESDPEEAKLSLQLRRRREASDDEGEEERESADKPSRRIESEGELDGEGAAAEYDNDNDEDEEELETEEEEYLEEEYEEREGKGGGNVAVVVERAVEVGNEAQQVVNGNNNNNNNDNNNNNNNNHNDNDNDNDNDNEVVVGEKKENEPFAVPTAGAFYMHDDRFQDNVAGRHRRTRGGRNLWESRDDRKWGHDKFEEMTMHERQYDEGRRYTRGRDKNRGLDNGYPQGNRPRAYNIQKHEPKSVRGRGPRRYQPSTNNSGEAPPIQNKQFRKSVEKTLPASSGRVSTPKSSVESDRVAARKHLFGSSLNSASPPFYPSGSSNKEITLTQKRNVQAGTINRNLRPSAIGENFSLSHPGAVLHGKNLIDSIGMDKLCIDESNSSVAGKHSTNLQFPPSVSSSSNCTQSPHMRVQGRGLAPLDQITYQPTAPQNQVNRVSSSTQLHTVQRLSGQSRIQPPLQASGQRLAQQPGSESQPSLPPKGALTVNSFEPGQLEATPESSKLRTALIGKGKGSVQGSGRGSVLYGGAHVMGASGNMGAGRGDQNFPGTPAFFPVMQFGSQHPGGIGVPAVGMAFPGYVAQPQGLGNSEMTWLPVLAGARGALGATYCPPYLAVDDAHHAYPSGQSSSLAASTSKENNTDKPSNEWQPSQRSELANDEFGHRQNKLRRYTEMKFDQ